jgi:hypothetical protein
VVSIGLDANIQGTNPVATAVIDTLESYGISNVAMWPDYNADGPGGAYVFMDPIGMSPSNASWFGLLSGFLAR